MSFINFRNIQSVYSVLLSECEKILTYTAVLKTVEDTEILKIIIKIQTH